MKYLTILLLSFVILTSCAKENNPELANTWDRIISVVKSDPLMDYTTLIYKHSTQVTADQSLAVVDVCLIDSDGMSKDELTALIELDPDQAKACWAKLMEYPKSDKRFFDERTAEFHVWQDFSDKKNVYEMLFESEEIKDSVN